MLRNTKGDRTLKENLMLASSTAFVAGGVNVAGVIAFLAFTSNVTGHVANLAKNIIDKDFRDIRIFVIWLTLFFGGAFVSSFIINTFRNKSSYKAHAVPIVIEIFILAFVAVYGNTFYRESQVEREIIIGCILFSMGLQNAMVSVISGGSIKSTHLTGLITDMGAEFAEWVHPGTEKSDVVKNKLYIRATILACYIFGGLVAGYFFNIYEFGVFYFVPIVLLSILYYDLAPIIRHKVSKLFLSSKNQAVNA